MILKLLVFPLVISFLAQTTAWLGRRRTVRKPVPPPRPGGCSYYKLLNTPDRFMKTPTVNVRCDKGDLTKFWYRFQGSAGTLIATVCPPVKHCGTHAPGWMTGKHPSKADGIVTRKVCYHWAADCCKWTNNIRVRNCSGFYIYELDKTPVCSLRYCGSGPDVDDCVGKPCKNGATCIDKHYSYECQCAVGYTGENCERKSVPPSACPTGDRIGCLTNATGFSLLPELLFTDSNKGSNVYSGVTIDWVNWNHYLATLTCRCAYNARKLGYEVFGLKISGECWSSNATNWKKSNNHLALSCSGKYKNISGQAQNICSWGDDIYYVYELLYYDVRVSRASVEDYISIKREIPTMTALTICTWIKTKDTRGSASMISYSEKGGSSNAVLLNNPVALWFWIGSVWKTGVSVADGEWHHVCTTWENVTGQTVTFKDGSRVANHTFKKGHVIKGGGILIIGQEQDKFGGGFQSSQNFIGDLFGINIWDNVLSDTNIEAMAVDSKMDVSGTVLNWDDVISGQKCGELQYVKASCKNVDRNFDIRVTRASVKDYVKLVTRKVPSMTAITICTWLKTLDSRSDATMISYAAKGSYNEVVLNIPKSLSFWIASSRWKTGVNVADNIWHHVCVTWENTAGQAAIFKDGNKTATHSFKKGHVIKADGILIVGQEQDKFGGGFQSSQNFIGDLFGITIWDRVLTAAEINTMAIDSNSDFSGNVLAWKDIPCQDIYGELKFIRPSLGKMPIASPGWYVLFDFENGQADLSKWTLTGTAFSNQPTYGDNPTARKKEPSNHKGNWWIGGAEDRPSPSDKAGAVQLDKPTGTMTSPHFTITGSKMRFLIGGGCAINWVRAELLIDGQVVDKATGKCSETMTTQEWEVEAQNFGKRAQVRLIDASSAGWGHINFDHFEMWYAPWTANYDIQFNRVSREDYVYVKKTLPRLTALTYCLWIKTADQNRARTIFSYKVPEAMYELILYYPQKLTYNLNNLQYNINVNVADDRWHHVCFTLDYKSQKVTLYKDGWSVKQNSLKGGTEIRPGGTLVIGQLQSTGSEFSYNWNYIGSLYGFNIWDKLLTAEEIKVMALDPKMDVSGNAISWSDIMSDAVYGKNNLIRKSSCRRSDANFDIKFTRASIKDYIKVKRPITSRIYSLSLCVWLKTADKRVGSGIFSYAVEGSDNEILLNQPKSLLFWIGSKSWNTGVNIADDRWHHVCVTWNQAAGQTAIFLDGKQASRTVLEPNHAIKYNQNSSIIIGQEQDKVGGGFQSTQNFIGELSGINLWRKILSLYEIEQMSLNPTKANEIQGSQGNVVQWTDAYCGYIGGETQVIDNQTSCKNTEIDFDIKFTRASAEDYVKISRPVPSMTAITLCVWLKTVDKRKASSVISYAVLGSTNEVLLNEPKSLLFWIGSSVWNTRLNVADGEWHHICGTWENSGGQALIYKDGQQAAKHAFKKGHVIKPNGALIIGQEQDSVGGGFQSTQNFIGELSGINIWNKVIRADEIKIMAIDYRANAAGNVLQWSDVFCEKKLGQTKIIKPTTSCKFINASAGWRVLFDFENDGLSKWTLTGTAFNNQPTYGDNPTARKREPSNHKGNWWIGGAENRPSPSDKAGAVQLDKPTGTMKSPPFRLTGTRLKFLISGGCGSSNKYSIYAGLYVRSGFYSRRILVTRPLRCSETMVEKEWSIQSHYLGSMAQVILVDSSTKGWGHINFDHLMMYEPPPVWTKLYDFEKGKDSLSTWTLTGTAFSNQPTYGDNPTARKKEPSNHKGNWWIGGAENRPSPSDKAGAVQLDKPQGNLTSPSFLITGYKLRFLIGGGCDSNVVRLELEVDEEIVAMATGKCLETMVTSEWDVSCYLGKLAKVRAVDQSSTGWGHINFDNIEMFSIVY